MNKIKFIAAFAAIAVAGVAMAYPPNTVRAERPIRERGDSRAKRVPSTQTSNGWRKHRPSPPSSSRMALPAASAASTSASTSPASAATSQARTSVVGKNQGW